MSHNVTFNPTTGLPMGCTYCGAVPPAGGFTEPCPSNQQPQPPQAQSR